MSHTTLLNLSSWQWAIAAVMHIPFPPPVTVGTSVLPIVCYGMDMRTNSQIWLQMFRFGAASSLSASRWGWWRASS
jgi:cytochrome bd-type quinol oxidase subunit 1